MPVTYDSDHDLNREDLRKREAATRPMDDDGAEPLDSTEQDAFNDIAGNYDREAPEPSFYKPGKSEDTEDPEPGGTSTKTHKSKEDDGDTKEGGAAADKAGGGWSYKNTKKKINGKLELAGQLKKKAKKKLIVGGVIGVGIIGLILMISLFMSSLKLPHFVANISAYEFARLSRNFSESAASVTEEKLAVDAGGGFAQGLKDQYGELRSSTWGKLDKYRPKKVMENMLADGEKSGGQTGMTFVEETAERKFFPGSKTITTGVKIDGKELTMGDSKWFKPVSNFQDRMEFNGRLTARLEASLQDSNTLVRGSVAKSIREDLGIKLRRWERLTKSYRNAKEAEAAEIKKTYEATKTEPTEQSAVDDVNEAEKAAREAADNCVESDPCVEQMAVDGGEQLKTDVQKQINVILKDNALKDIAGTASTVYSIALPVCLIYDASVERSGPTVDANSARAEKTWYTVASGAHQQIAGDAAPSQIGGLNDELGDITTTPSETRARGGTVDTSEYANPEADNTQSYNIFTAIFGGTVGKVFDELLSPTCPTITDPAVGLGFGAAEMIITIGSGGTIEGVDASVRQVVTHMMDQILTKDFAKTFGKRLARDTILITGGSILAKLIVFARMGNMDAPIPDGPEMGVQADQGANLAAGGIERQQLYGRPMSTEEIVMSNYQDYQDVALANSQQSLYDRYINPHNPTSVFTNTAIGISMNFEKSIPQLMQGFVSKLGDLMQPDTGLLSILLGGSHNRVAAASIDTNYNIIQWGWTDQEMAVIAANPKLYSPINVAETMERSGQLDSLKSSYDKCFTQSIGELLASHDIVRDGNGQISDGEGHCAPNNLGPSNPEAFRYRIYMRNNAVLDHLDSIQNYTAATTGSQP